MKLVDLTGQTFGRLEVVARAANVYGSRVAWLCRCVCGSEIVVAGCSLTRGKTNSCGCLRRNDHDVVTYEGAHWRVRQAKGSASAHSCADCGAPAAQWAYDYRDSEAVSCSTRKSLYSLDPAHYEPRCVSCHKLHDLAHSNLATRPRGAA